MSVGEEESLAKDLREGIHNVSRGKCRHLHSTNVYKGAPFSPPTNVRVRPCMRIYTLDFIQFLSLSLFLSSSPSIHYPPPTSPPPPPSPPPCALSLTRREPRPIAICLESFFNKLRFPTPSFQRCAPLKDPVRLETNLFVEYQSLPRCLIM